MNKKILIVTQDSSGWGGAEVLLNLLSIGFIKSGYSVSSISNLKKFNEKMSRSGANAIYVPFRMDVIGGYKGLLKFIFQSVYGFIWYGKIIKREKPDIVYISGFTEKIIVTIVSKLEKIPVIWLEHAPLEEVFRRNCGIGKMLYKTVMNIPESIINYSINTKRHITVNPGIDKNKIKVIPIGIPKLSTKLISKYKTESFDLRKELGFKKDDFVIGVVSRLQKEKGQDELIKAFCKLKSKKRTKLVIVGEGDYEDKLKKMVEKCRNKKDIIFTGFIGDKDKWKYYSMFDLFVFPTRWEMEGFGIVILEAMMLGTPILASDKGPVPEIIKDSGVLVNPKANLIKKEIERIIDSDKLGKDLSKQSTERFKHFDYQKSVDMYLKVFAGILNKKNGE